MLLQVGFILLLSTGSAHYFVSVSSVVRNTIKLKLKATSKRCPFVCIMFGVFVSPAIGAGSVFSGNECDVCCVLGGVLGGSSEGIFVSHT